MVEINLASREMFKNKTALVPCSRTTEHCACLPWCAQRLRQKGPFLVPIVWRRTLSSGEHPNLVSLCPLVKRLVLSAPSSPRLSLPSLLCREASRPTNRLVWAPPELSLGPARGRCMAPRGMMHTVSRASRPLGAHESALLLL